MVAATHLAPIVATSAHLVVVTVIVTRTLLSPSVAATAVAAAATTTSVTTTAPPHRPSRHVVSRHRVVVGLAVYVGRIVSVMHIAWLTRVLSPLIVVAVKVHVVVVLVPVLRQVLRVGMQRLGRNSHEGRVLLADQRRVGYERGVCIMGSAFRRTVIVNGRTGKERRSVTSFVSRVINVNR